MRAQALLLLKMCFSCMALATPAAAVQVSTIPYGPDKAQVLDLYTPDTTSTVAMPTVVLAHGGLWQSGGRNALANLCSNIVTRSGGAIACASIDYRLSQDLGGVCSGTGKGTYTDQVLDLALAYALLQSKSGTYGLDPKSMHVGGHSAGAHLAQTLNLRWSEFAQQCKLPEGCPVAISAIGFEGIYDIRAWNSYDVSFWNGRFQCATRKAFGAPGTSPEACFEDDSDEHCWDAGSPALLAQNVGGSGRAAVGDVLLIHSPGDDWVDIAEAKNFGVALITAFPQIDVITKINGSCAKGQHNDTLDETSLADCIIEFIDTRVPMTPTL